MVYSQIIGVEYVYFNQTNCLDRRERTLTITAYNESFSSRVGVTEHCYYSVRAFNHFTNSRPKRKSRKFCRDEVVPCGAIIFLFSLYKLYKFIVIFYSQPRNWVRLICVSDDVFWDSANDCKGKHHKCGLKINKGMYIDVACKFNMGLSLITLPLLWCPKGNIYITIEVTTKFPFQGSRAYILLSYLFILKWKTMNYLFNYDYYFSAWN